MNKDELINTITTLQKTKEEKENQLAELKKELEALSVNIDTYKDELLANMKDDNTQEYSANGFTAGIMTRKDASYKDEKAILEWLKENNQEKFVKTKVTESIDKVALKKEFKINESFQTNLKDYMEPKVTEYVVVTTSEKFNEMMTHVKTGA